MGREQGDHLPKNPTVYVRENEKGEVEERSAFTPTDEVNLKARGWVKKNAKRAGRRVPASKADAAPAGAAANERKDG